jgi:spore coat protein H
MLFNGGAHATRWRWRAAVAGGILATAIIATAAQDSPTSRVRGDRDEAPDYGRVFALDRVHDVRITIPAERFQQMQANLATFGRGRGAGPLGRAGMPGPPPDGLAMAAALQESVLECSGKSAGAACSSGGVVGACAAGPMETLMCVAPGQPPRGRAAGGGPFLSLPNPIAVPVSVQFLGRTWTNVRMRYKGNSSLMGALGSANPKLPFRLDFDKDASAPDRTFHGFRKLTFSSNFADDSQLREVLAGEILRNRGVPAARAAFYRVYVDAGEGAKYWGLYTMVEDPADGPMLDAQLGGRTGNLYKPEGPAANWTRFDAASFEKKTNEREADFSDVIAAIDALNADMNDSRAWRARLERVFDVDLFLRWLAVNTVIDNWDTYGAMAHNYYLYGDGSRGGRLRWVPWDHNMAFGAGPGAGPAFGGRGFPGRGAGDGGGRGFPGPFGRGATDVLHRNVSTAWPLISRLLSVPEYSARYRSFLADGLSGMMDPDALAKRVRELHTLIAPAMVGSAGELKADTTGASEAAFRASPDALLKQIALQRERIRTALAVPQ